VRGVRNTSTGHSTVGYGGQRPGVCVCVSALCSASLRRGSRASAWPLTLSCLPCNFHHSVLSVIGHWAVSVRLKHTFQPGGSPRCFVCKPSRARIAFDCAVWAVEEVYAAGRSSSRGPALHRVGSAMLAADADRLENGCCSISISRTCLAGVVSAFVRRQMFPEEQALRDASPI
jgi:hypothetical protein